MATGSESQLITFTRNACAKSRPDFPLTFFRMGSPSNFLRRAYKPQKCFVSGETESVANTSAFVGPVAFFSNQHQTFALR
jgi:hypothetical protein